MHRRVFSLHPHRLDLCNYRLQQSLQRVASCDSDDLLMEIECGSIIFVKLVFSQMLALHFDIRLQAGDLSLRYPLGRKPCRHSLQCLARHVDLDCPVGIVIYQIHSKTGDDLDNALGLETIDGSPQGSSAHSELAAELFDADLVARTVAAPAQEELAHECIGVAAET